MAHELAFFTDGRARLAYVGQVPWHGLGTELTAGASLETWAQEAGMNFEILGAPVTFQAASGKTYAQGSKQVLYRADTDQPLGVVGNKYKVVQPIAILEFFRNLVEEQGFQLETAGVLFNGAKYFAMANTGESFEVSKGEHIRQRLMLATACDGSLKTTAKFVAERVVCNNTLSIALGEDNPKGTVKVSHSSTFDAGKMQADLGLVSNSWAQYMQNIKALAKRKVSKEEAQQFVIDILGNAERSMDENMAIPAVGKVLSLAGGFAKGSEFKSMDSTAWSLLNSITEYSDWHIGKNQDRRLEAAWFYQNDTLKTFAYQKACALL
jgi:phage/plasmid-like protein (TIGR03299 family)